jgi:6-pyruvoyltetrahydropterin/6-carboxytetrahydropterin synthase
MGTEFTKFGTTPTSTRSLAHRIHTPGVDGEPTRVARGVGPFVDRVTGMSLSAPRPGYSVSVRDHVLIAHRLQGAVFGPAQKLHGATYVVTVELYAEKLDQHGIVVDIGLATRVLGEALAPLRYADLDALPAFAGRNSTSEVLAEHVHAEFGRRIAPHFQGWLNVRLDESPMAAVSFAGPVPAARGLRAPAKKRRAR